VQPAQSSVDCLVVAARLFQRFSEIPERGSESLAGRNAESAAGKLMIARSERGTADITGKLWIDIPFVNMRTQAIDYFSIAFDMEQRSGKLHLQVGTMRRCLDRRSHQR
jgi:hypothetical protein